MESDGTILSVAGGGSYWWDNVSGSDARISGRGIAVGPDGGLYVAEQNRIRKVGTFVTGNSPGDLTIPSEDGSELYVFNSRGRHLRTLDSITSKVLYEFSYDEGKRLVGIKDMDGLTTKVERDASGNPTAIVAPNGERTALSTNDEGYLASITNPANEEIDLSYGRGGLLASFSKPKGSTSRFSYDEIGRLTKDEDAGGGFKALSKRTTPKGVAVDLTTAEGRKTTYETEPLAGGQTRRVITDPSGLKTDKTLSSTGDVLQSKMPDGTIVQSSMYSDPRFGAQSSYQGYATVKTPSGLTFTKSSNRSASLKDWGNPLSATTVTNSTSLGWWRTYTSTFDTASKKVTNRTPAGRQGVATVDEKGRVVAKEFGGLSATSYEYDGRGRLTKAITGAGANSRTVTYEYDLKDRVKSVTDPAGRSTSFEYDEAGRVTKQVLPDTREILYSYDANGNLTSLTPPGKPEHSFSYTERDQANQYSAPSVGWFEANSTTYEYNLDKQLTAVNRPGGEKLSLSYDAGGRPTKVTAGTGADAPANTYAYDPQTGNVADVTAPDGKLSYAYDGFLPTSETLAGEVSGKVSYKYDNNFWVSSVAVNSEAPINYYYDYDGLLNGAGALGIYRDPKHGAITGTRLNNMSDSNTYDAFGGLASYKTTFQNYYYNAPEDWFSASYKRDSLGRIVEKTEAVGDVASTYAYAYDGAGRLVEVRKDGQKVASYSYDKNGNRLSETTLRGGTVEATYDAQDRLVKRGQAEYSYAPSGELKGKTEGGQTTSYAYDAFGNLKSAALPGGKKVEYLADGKGRRIGKKIDGRLVKGFLYSGQLAPAAELDGTGKVVNRFVYGTKANVPDYMVRDGKTYRLVTDHLGSVRLVANAQTGEIV